MRDPPSLDSLSNNVFHLMRFGGGGERCSTHGEANSPAGGIIQKERLTYEHCSLGVSR